MAIALAIVCMGSCFGTSAGTPIDRHTISSRYQPEPMGIEVLSPDTVDPDKRYPVLYILPVESGATSRWGNGMEEARKADIANRYGVFCVYPAFAATPWFADHPTDLALRQESHFIKAVLPLVERNYPVDTRREGRFLLGFSKSGYGAVMLLLRHPDLFERAVAWDAPIDKTAPDQFRMVDVFGTAEHFGQYAIPSLVVKQAGLLKQTSQPRLFLMPNREGDHAMGGVHRQLEEMGVPHVFEYTEPIAHHWNSGWVPRAAELLLTGTGMR